MSCEYSLIHTTTPTHSRTHRAAVEINIEVESKYKGGKALAKTVHNKHIHQEMQAKKSKSKVNHQSQNQTESRNYHSWFSYFPFPSIYKTRKWLLMVWDQVNTSEHLYIIIIVAMQGRSANVIVGVKIFPMSCMSFRAHRWILIAFISFILICVCVCVRWFFLCFSALLRITRTRKCCNTDIFIK